MLKKLLASILLASILLTTLIVPVARAQTWYNQGFTDWRAKVFNSPEEEIFGERYTHAQVQWIIYSLANFILTGGDPQVNEAFNCLVTNAGDVKDCKDSIISLSSQPSPFASKLNTNQKSAWNNPFEFFTSQPLSGVGYFINKASSLKFIPEARAQEGFGFGSFGLILGLWKAVRNIAFTLITIAIIAIAFMIMFRVKISPQAVITVQSALPKIVIGIILITFSYAIAGLLVDLMYVVIGLIATFIKGGGLTTYDNWGDLFSSFVDKNAVGYLAKYFILLAIPLFIILAGFGIVAVFGVAVTGGASGVALFIVLGLVIVAFIIFLWNAFKIIFMLIKTYVKIGLLVIGSPLFALMGIVSSGFGFGDWLKLMISNLAVFPVVGIFFFLAFYFLAAGTPILGELAPGLYPFSPDVSSLGGAAWNPPLFNVGTGPVGLHFLAIFMSFVVITLIPKTVEIIQGMIERKPFAYGTAIGEAFGPIKAAGIPAGEAFYELGREGGEVGPITLGPRGREVASLISRGGEFLGIFPKRR
ncbi:hypothetical protein KAT60_01140 [Candidatus Woesebacteria bacterium]|nr:hypothetical protein [Candidatus Woesebacteria bacterium]